MDKRVLDALPGRRLSRRSVLLRGGALAALGLVSPILAACGGDDDDAPSQGGSSTSPTPAAGNATSAATTAPTTATSGQEPASGGTALLGYIDEPPTMDPRVTGSAKASNLMVNLFDSLVWLDRESGDLAPGLATSWEISEDGQAYTFELRDDVKFHDGTDFNGEAVKYTFDSIQDPDLKSLTAIGYLGPYDHAEVVDDFTVTVHFTESYAPFLNTASTSVLAPVSPTAAEEMGPSDFARAPVGTGPFKFKEWQQQASMTFERNPDYAWAGGIFEHEGPAYLDEVVVKFIPEATTLTGSLESGEINIADGILAQDVENFRANDAFQVLVPTVPGVPQILPLNAAKAPTDELAVRQAIITAVDTPTIVETMFFGALVPGKGPLASSTWSYNPAVEEYYAYDPEEAGRLLDEAGWTMGSGGVREKNGQLLEIDYITQTGQAGDAGELVQAYLTQVGFRVNLQILEYAATAELYLQGAHHIARIGYTGTDPIALSTVFHSRNIPGTNFNRTMKPDDELDTMLDDAAAETDRDTRLQMYHDIQIYIMEQALMIPLWEQSIIWGASSKLEGLNPMSLGQISFYDVRLTE